MGLAGTSDLAAGQRKFSGNAQQRKKRFLLHHGTLLYSLDFIRVARYLRLPPREPEYRAGRSHDQFLCNLAGSAADLKERLKQEWKAMAGTPDVPMQLVENLEISKYITAEWTHRR